MYYGNTIGRVINPQGDLLAKTILALDISVSCALTRRIHLTGTGYEW